MIEFFIVVFFLTCLLLVLFFTKPLDPQTRFMKTKVGIKNASKRNL